MKRFFTTLPRNLIACFRGRMLLWHLLAIGVTVLCVLSGLDWHYYRATRSPVLWAWMIPSAPIGMFVPFLLPLGLIVIGRIMKRIGVVRAGWAIAQAELLGSIISSTYKAVTGRVHPFRIGEADISGEFRFGILRGGVFWGWPSSHTTIAFAMAVTVFILFPRQRWLGWLALAYALYIGLGISMTIHWFSDFVAGAIVGSVIGTVVGKSVITRD